MEVEETPRKPGWIRGEHGDGGLSDSWVKIAIGLREDLMKKCVCALYARDGEADRTFVCKDTPRGG